MKIVDITFIRHGAFVVSSSLCFCSLAQATPPWSLVPYAGLSQLSDQSPNLNGSDDIANGPLNVGVDQGFTAGLGVRYDYNNTPWSSEFGWEYRSNDINTVSADGTLLPSGNYASNLFYLNGRYAFDQRVGLTPWVGGGLTWVQEIDLDSEDADSERSFSDGGAVGYQLMIGANYNLTKRFYFTGELRYSSLTGIDLSEEGSNAVVSDIDYETVTMGAGIGFRF